MATQPNEADLQKLEDQTFDESDSFELPPSDIVAYNELRSCADLFRMQREGILDIHPGFQREIVWPLPAQTRFIDSLVKQLPIPSMCFSLDYKAQKWQVIDGLQRMWSIIQFLSGERWRLSRLEDVDPALSGQWVPNFLDRNSNLYQYYTRIENLTLPITVIRCDYSKNSHMNYLFTIFHRLNRGAITLNNQEIRNCIFSGPFNDFLKEMDQNEDWLKVTGRTASTGDRYRGQELILRFLAFHDNYKGYGGRLASFLNDYMKAHREPDEEFLNGKRDIFTRTVRIVYNSVFGGRVHERPGISALEAALVGVSLNLADLERRTNTQIRELYETLLRSEEFSEDRLREGLSGRPRVLGRMSTAERVFSGQ
ncbi:DUF262 domain-containing protein [Chloroflexota bacterium]